MKEMAMRTKFMVIVGTAVVAVLALSGVAWAATALAVTKTVPKGGTTGIATTANVKAFFNNNVKTSTVTSTSTTFKIRKQGTTIWLGATRSVNNNITPTSTNGGSESVATLNPAEDLAPNTTYQVVVVGGSSGVKDVNGQALGSNKSWTFTTAVATAPPPETTIDKNPPDPDNRTSATFEFSASEPGSTFQCALDDPLAYSPCTSPKTVPDSGSLADGAHTFYVKATGAAGNNTDTTPATYTWKVDTAAPNTTINTKPADPSNNASPSFTFSGTDNITPSENLTFECKLDNEASYTPCTAPKALSNLSDSSHTFSVRAKDAAGNVDDSPESYTWKVDAAVPTVTFTPEDTMDVAPNTNVRATFSEAMNAASVESQGTFTLQADGSSTPVEATVTYNSVTKSATLDPGTDLALNTTYTATLTTEAKDLGGNALAQERTWTFKTANAPRNVTVTPATLDFGNIVGIGFTCPSRTLPPLEVTNNSSYDVTYGGVSIAGTPSGKYFVTGLETFIRQNGPGTQLAGDHFFDQVTINPSGNQTYAQKLTYLDDTGAPIGNPVALKATSECLAV